MPTSTSKRGPSAGFTLVEMLVVVLLLGLGLGVGLTLDFAGSPQQQKQHTLLLANALELAAQDAVLDGKVLGLDFFAAGAQDALAYRWVRLQEEGWKPYPLRDAEAETLLPAELIATLTLAGQTIVPEPRTELGEAETFVAGLAPASTFSPEVLLLPTRELTPFTLTLGSEAGSASTLTADLMGRVRVDEDAPTPP
jgi:general secretion pathway protein H